jgi:hypothetical protein
MSSDISDNAFSEVRVRHTFKGNTSVYWEPRDEDLYSLPATVEWAHTPNGSWHAVDDALVVSDGHIIDPRRRLYGKDLDLFYRVRLEPSPSRFVYSFPMQIGYDYSKETWLKFKEMLRLAELTYRTNPLAVNVCLLKRRIHGRRCRACRDPGSEHRVNTDCPVCFGTQVVGGYYPAYPMRMVEGKKARKYSYANEMAGMDLDSRRTGAVVAYPVQMDERDVIVNTGTGERFLVAALKQSEITNHVQVANLVIVQQFDFDVISSEHIVYKVPLDGCGVYGQRGEEPDPCADPPDEGVACDHGEEEERQVFPDVPVVPEPPRDPEKDGAELVWPGY